MQAFKQEEHCFFPYRCWNINLLMRNLSRGRLILIVILTISSSLAPGAKNVEDWTLDEVLAKVAEANGGVEAIERVTNARIIGNVEGDASYDFLLLKRRPNKMRSRMMMYKKVVETGFDGSIVWRRYEQGDYDKVELVDDPEFTRNIELEADFDGPLIGEIAQGLTLELKGVERLDRIDYFVVEVKSEESSALHYVDTRTFRELKLVKTVFREGMDPLVITSNFHDIEKHSGIWVSHRVEKEMSNGNKETIHITTVEMNPGILDFSFKMPKERNPVPGN